MLRELVHTQKTGRRPSEKPAFPGTHPRNYAKNHYILYGLLAALCGHSLARAKSTAFAWKTGLKAPMNLATGPFAAPGENDCEADFQYNRFLSQFIEAGWWFAGHRITRVGGGRTRKVKTVKKERRPLAMTLPKTDNPMFVKKCKACSDKPKTSGSFNFELFHGMGSYYYEIPRISLE